MSVLLDLFFPPDKRYGHWEGPKGESVWLEGKGVWRAHERFKRCQTCGGRFWFGPKQEDYYQDPRLRLKDGEIVCEFCNGKGYYYSGSSPKLGCPHCDHGITTPARERKRKNWEQKLLEERMSGRRPY